MPTVDMPTVDLRLLVIAADGVEPSLVTIKQILDYLGTPYTVHVAAHAPGALTPDVLSHGEHALYHGIILTTGNLGHARGGEWASALSPEEWQALRAYEARFGIRQIAWYTYPTADYGFQMSPTDVDSGVRPIMARFTPAGRSVFPSVNAREPLEIRGVYAYLAQPLGDERVVPLLQDPAGNALALVRTWPDRCQNLALTFDSNPSAAHAPVLAYDLVNWVSRGLFVGEHHVCLNVQVDDMFMGDRVWPADAPCGTPPGGAAINYRMSAADLRAVAAWQRSKRAEPILEQFRLSFAFNGCGAVDDSADDAAGADTLMLEVARLRDEFYWVSHTYDHTSMDDMDYATARSEIEQNIATARDLGLAAFSPRNLITPGMSGLNNPDVLRAAYDCGVRYVVSDASRTGQGNPSPNAGLAIPHQPSPLAIPRHPTNLYYDVTTPEEWVSEYNCQYASHWGRNLTYEEILDRESQTILTYLLLGDIDPIMFHQSNLRAYDGSHSLLSDLLDRTLAKYGHVMSVPIVCPPLDEVGERMAARMQRDDAGVAASVVGERQIALSVQRAATVPVTGLASLGPESCGRRRGSYIGLEGGQSVTLPLPSRHASSTTR